MVLAICTPDGQREQSTAGRRRTHVNERGNKQRSKTRCVHKLRGLPTLVIQKAAGSAARLRMAYAILLLAGVL
jgi:hypothetical protein